ncbi:hypothetical protein PYCC9005_001173 [Savitreella phatthalungensis]
MFCALSGEPPQDPVVSRSSGAVFERRLLEAYLRDNDGRDPVSGEAISSDVDGGDIISIRLAPEYARPRAPTAAATSIPGLLAAFQAEWDATALECFELRRQLQQCRQELSAALYQNDAATRVIARITTERDEARKALASVSDAVGQPASHEQLHNGHTAAATEPDASLPQHILQAVSTTQQQLSAIRRTQKGLPEGWTTLDQIKSFVVDDRENEEAVAARSELDRKEADQELVAFHPSGEFLVKGEKQADTWSICEYANGQPSGTSKILATRRAPAPLNAIAIHPDGHLVALGAADGKVYIYSFFSDAIEATIELPAPLPHGSKGIVSLSFSENGFWLAIARHQETTIGIWHLGKDSLAATLQIPTDNVSPHSLRTVSFDRSGRYVAAGTDQTFSIFCWDKPSKSWITAIHTSDTGASQLAWLPYARGIAIRHHELDYRLFTLP